MPIKQISVRVELKLNIIEYHMSQARIEIELDNYMASQAQSRRQKLESKLNIEYLSKSGSSLPVLSSTRYNPKHPYKTIKYIDS